MYRIHNFVNYIFPTTSYFYFFLISCIQVFFICLFRIRIQMFLFSVVCLYTLLMVVSLCSVRLSFYNVHIFVLIVFRGYERSVSLVDHIRFMGLIRIFILFFISCFFIIHLAGENVLH